MVVVRECFPTEKDFIINYVEKRRKELQVIQERQSEITCQPRPEEGIKPFEYYPKLFPNKNFTIKYNKMENSKLPENSESRKRFNDFLQETENHLFQVLANNQRIDDVHLIVEEIQKPFPIKRRVKSDAKYGMAEEIPNADIEVENPNKIKTIERISKNGKSLKKPLKIEKFENIQEISSKNSVKNQSKLNDKKATINIDKQLINKNVFERKKIKNIPSLNKFTEFKENRASKIRFEYRIKNELKTMKNESRNYSPKTLSNLNQNNNNNNKIKDSKIPEKKEISAESPKTSRKSVKNLEAIKSNIGQIKSNLRHYNRFNKIEKNSSNFSNNIININDNININMNNETNKNISSKVSQENSCKTTNSNPIAVINLQF